MTLAVISLGGNVGDVVSAFDSANQALSEMDEVHDLRTASVHRSEPMGKAAGSTFWNSATSFETSLAAEQLLDRLQAIENDNGRTRAVRWGPRTLDLDLIFYGDQIINTPRLCVPHPQFFFRRFVIAPTSEIVPNAVDPVSGRTIGQFHQRLTQRPMRILLSKQIDIELVRVEFQASFPFADFELANSDDDVSGCVLGVCVSEPERSAESTRFWIRIDDQDPVAEIRWILQAAS
jgi:2-amino-4-hydroxy-6-hydroxymethyldihydropteridine diphosphokinase